MNGNWLDILGVLAILVSLGAGIRMFGEPTREKWPAYVGLLAWFALVSWVLLIDVLSLYGGIALVTIVGYVGVAVINKAHTDIRPDTSRMRRRLYTTVQ